MTARRQRAGSILVRVSVVLAVALVPLLVNPANRDDPFYGVKAGAVQILGVFILLGVAMMGRDQLRPARIPWRPLGAFALAATAATLLGIDPRWSLVGAPWRHEGLLTLLAYALVCAGTAVMVAEGAGETWLAAALVGAGTVALLGMAQFTGWEGLPRDVPRAAWRQAYATMGNPNWLGSYVILAVPLAAAALAAARSRVLRIAGGVLVPLLLAAGLLTFSRSTWALLAVTVVVAAAFAWRHRRGPGLRVAVLLVPALVLLLGGIALRGELIARVRDLRHPITGPIQERRYFWRESVRLLVARPLLGYGPEALPLVFPQAWTDEKRRIFGNEPLVIDKAHNETLDMALSIGGLGVGAFWWVIAGALRGAGRRSALAGGCLAGAIAYLVHLQFHFSVVSIAPVFWSVLGAAYGEGVRTGGVLSGAEPGAG